MPPISRPIFSMRLTTGTGASAARLAAIGNSIRKRPPAHSRSTRPRSAVPCARLPVCRRLGHQNHGELMKKAFDTSNSIGFPTDQPLMYQACSDDFMGPCDPSRPAMRHGGGFRRRTRGHRRDVPGRLRAKPPRNTYAWSCWPTTSACATHHGGTRKGFGFYQSKPASSFSPVAVTPDELAAPGAIRGCTCRCASP